MELIEQFLSKIEKNIINYGVLSAIFVFNSVLTIYFLVRDTRPPAWDQSLHLTLSLIYKGLLGSGRIFDIIGVSDYYPPLYHLSTIPLYIFGNSEDVATCVNLVYALILILSVYGIGSHLFDNKTGLLASFMIIFTPFAIAFQREYMLEFALVAMFSMSLFLLLKSDSFKNFEYSVFFGISVALLLLIKWTGILFLIGPILWVLLYMEKNCPVCGKPGTIKSGLLWFCSKRHMEKYIQTSGTQIPSNIKNLSFAFLIAVALAGIWYLPNLGGVVNNVLFFSQAKTSQPGVIEKDPSVLSLESFLFHINALYNHLNLVFTLFALAGIAYLIFKKERRLQIFFGLSLVIPYILFTLIRNKDARFLTPVLILLVLLSVFWIREQKRHVQIACVSVILIAALLQVSVSTFGTPDILNGAVFTSKNQPREENWKVNDALGSIYASLGGLTGRRDTVVVLPDYIYVNGRTYAYYATREKMPLDVYNGAYIPYQTFQRILNQIDFLIYKNGGEVGSDAYAETVTNMYSYFAQNRDRFSRISEFPLPDGSRLEVYKNKALQ